MEGDVLGQASQRDLHALSRASRIYIATVRRDGDQSKSVAVWFTLTLDHSVLIQTGRSSWIARRVRRGSPVIVWIGRRNGPALIGNAEISKDPKLTKRIVDDYPRKYLLARLGFHRPRQERFDAGQILAIKIMPVRDLPEGFGSAPGSRAPSIGDTEPLSDRPSPRRQSIARAQLANLLSASRFVLAGLWLVAFVSGNRGPGVLGPIALAAAVSDFADGRIARWMDHADGFGRWLDPLADIVFILTALSSEALAGAIPIYIPVLIACSFAQYAIDSVVMSSSSTPVKSRLGHWGGVLNFALVLVFAWTPPRLLPARPVRQASPLLALFYIAAIVERALNYWPSGAIRRDKMGKAQLRRALQCLTRQDTRRRRSKSCGRIRRVHE
jgi:phosphatidylglycerophosphate synthase